MRCKNCGWENQDNSLRCEKCNAPLMGSMVDHYAFSDKSPVGQQGEPTLKGTVKESDVFHNNEVQQPMGTPDSFNGEVNASSICPKCGYPIHPDMSVCPSCGYPVKKAAKPKKEKEDKTINCPKCGYSVKGNLKFCPNCGSSLRMGTVNNWINPSKGVFCTLKPVSWINEGIDHQPISYSGEVIVLNRANTDPNNNTITSKEQAILTHDGKDWYIENRSEQETTYIKVSRKTKLVEGDVIILGNRLFEFNG